MRARIQGHESIFEMMRLAEGGAPVSRIEHGRVCPVGDQLNPSRPPDPDMLAVPRAVHDHLVRAAIEEALQPLGDADQGGVGQHTHCHRKLRPQVAHFEQELRSLQTGQRPGRHALEDGRGSAPNDIHVLHTEAQPE